MINSFTINNFRCFESLTVEPLERINIIIGNNNVGKTALLEALYLHIGATNPELPLRVNTFRGIEKYEIDPVNIWGWLFFNKIVDNPIELNSKDDSGINRSLKIELRDIQESYIDRSEENDGRPESAPGALATFFGNRELLMSYKDSTPREGTCRAYLTQKGIKLERPSFNAFPPSYYVYSRLYNPKEDAERFSRLEEAIQVKPVLEILKQFESRLHRLTVIIAGGEPMIHGELEGTPNLVPIPLMGGGMARLLSMLLAIHTAAPGGVILIDEIENGFHHLNLQNVWAAIAESAKKLNVQIIASTHSLECIEAAHDVFVKTDMSEFRLHRLERIDETIKCITYDLEMLETVRLTDLEVR